MPKLKVLVTGRAGFIGSHLVDRLVNDGCDVRIALAKGLLKDSTRDIRWSNWWQERVYFIEINDPCFVACSHW
jgi:nucleoside-diphosphate-sugar epimerase